MAELTFKCPGCGETLEAPEEMAGQEVACPACNQPLTIPSVTNDAESEKTVSREAVESEVSGTKCPSCGNILEKESVLCVKCGYHLKLGRKIDTQFK